MARTIRRRYGRRHELRIWECRRTAEPPLSEAPDSVAVEARAKQLVRRFAVLREELGRSLLGQDELIEDLLTALLAGGHVLLEGLPGLGKTLLVKSLAKCLGLQFSRVQFTPDLMPADITGTRIVDHHGERLDFRFQKGPLFANLVLADEVNRTTPKTQSALLEAMQEGSVTVADRTHPLPRPFTVVATQNPIELEGTYPLPEAQIDRFLFHLVVRSPGVEDLVTILSSTTGEQSAQLREILSGAEVLEFQQLVRQVLCGAHLVRFVAELLVETNPQRAGASADTRRLVRYGASPRAGQAIILAAKARALCAGRPSVELADIEHCLLPALRHRVVMTFEAEAEGQHVENLLPGWSQSVTQRIR
jgi:MoxR-like ATPase